jgi:hypothetical protein
MVRLRAANALVDNWPALAVLLAIALLLPAQALAQTLAQAPTPASDALLTLPRDLSPWGMFMAADIVVKAVMVGLAFASVLTWTIWLAKTLELVGALREVADGGFGCDWQIDEVREGQRVEFLLVERLPPSHQTPPPG